MISTLRWADTRDMTADAHTKGSIDRAAILRLMRGLFHFGHAVKDFTPKRKLVIPRSLHVSRDANSVQLPQPHNKIGDGPRGQCQEPEVEEFNPFVLLGIGNLTQSEALALNPDELTRLFRKRTPSLHPDKRLGSEVAKREFQLAQSAVDLLKEQSSDFLTTNRKRSLVVEFLPIVHRTSTCDNEKLLPGHFLMQQNLLWCHNKRAQHAWSNVAPTSTTVKEEMVRTYDEMKGKQKQPFQFTEDDKSTKETRDAATLKMRKEAARQQVGKRLDRTLQRIDKVKARGKSDGNEHNGIGCNRIKRAARGWEHAAMHKFKVEERASKARTAAETAESCEIEDPETLAKEACRKYRREGNEWTPPPDPKYRKPKSTAAKLKKRLRRNMLKSLKKARRPKLCDAPTGGRGTVAESTRRGDPDASPHGCLLASRPKCRPGLKVLAPKAKWSARPPLVPPWRQRS